MRTEHKKFTQEIKFFSSQKKIEFDPNELQMKSAKVQNPQYTPHDARGYWPFLMV